MASQCLTRLNRNALGRFTILVKRPFFLALTAAGDRQSPIESTLKGEIMNQYLLNIEDKLHSEKEAAVILRKSPTTMWRLRQRNKISFRRDGQAIWYTRVDLIEYLERIKNPALV